MHFVCCSASRGKRRLTMPKRRPLSLSPNQVKSTAATEQGLPRNAQSLSKAGKHPSAKSYSVGTRPRNINLRKTNMKLTYTDKIWVAAMFITMVGAFIAAGQTENFNTINSSTTGVGGHDVRVTAESQTQNDLLPATMVSDEAPAVANYFEGFEDVGPTGSPDSGPQNLINQGWIFRNQSSPLGTDSWFQGYAGYIWPPPQAGSGYMAVTSNSTDFFGGTVSNWAILPALQGQQAGDEVRFYLTDLYGTDGDNISTLQ